MKAIFKDISCIGQLCMTRGFHLAVKDFIAKVNKIVDYDHENKKEQEEDTEIGNLFSCNS